MLEIIVLRLELGGVLWRLCDYVGLLILPIHLAFSLSEYINPALSALYIQLSDLVLILYHRSGEAKVDPEHYC